MPTDRQGQRVPSTTVRVLGFVFALAVAGCTSGRPEPLPPTTTPLPPVTHHPKAEVPKDRDEQAVLAALRQIDPCALLDPAAAIPPIPATEPTVDALGPHRCALTDERRDWMTVTVGQVLGARYWLQPVKHRPAQVVEFVTVHDCTKAEALAASVMKVLDGDPPSAAAPQRPLTYRPDEPDAPAAGACIDLDPGLPCEPYHQVSVPAGPDQALHAAHSDPNVTCAIALDPIRAHFGAAMQPVTTTGERSMRPSRNGSCVFVEPTHAVQVRVEISMISVQSDSQQTGAGLTIAGHPGVRADQSSDSGVGVKFIAFGVMVSTGDSLASAGHIEARVRFTHPRGTDQTSPLDTSRSSALQPMLTDILSRHFP